MKNLHCDVAKWIAGSQFVLDNIELWFRTGKINQIPVGNVLRTILCSDFPFDVKVDSAGAKQDIPNADN